MKNLRCVVTRIDAERRNERNMRFIRIYADVYLESGEKKWAKTDAVLTFKNFRNFKGILNIGVGAEFTGRLKDARTIDADSVQAIKKPIIESN